MVLDLTTAAGLLNLLGDPTRMRLLALIAEEELTVAELTRITDLTQSRVSTHLGRLREAGLLRDRRVGASTRYTVSEASMQHSAREIWLLVRSGIEDALLDRDRERREALIAARERVEAWPDAVAGRMERHYSPGRTWEATARGLLGLADLGDVLDVGSGDGVIAHLLAPRARSITCLDRSEKVIAAARERLARYEHVHFSVGDMHRMPFDDSRFDQVLLSNVLTYSEEPLAVFREASRVSRPGARISVVTLLAHRHEDVASTYQHVNSGFRPPDLRAGLEQAGLEVEICEVTSRERQKPYFQVVSAFARKAGKMRDLKRGPEQVPA